jgi:signal transduction histidine kinase
MVARSLKAVAESSELLKKAQLLKRIGKAVVTKIYDLDLAITRAIRRVHPEAEEKGVKITYEKTDAFVQGSPMLEELFLNLLENSIRHGNCKRIEITTGVHGDYCIIWVDDDGEGLPRELRKSVFEKGVRSEKSPGRGLGLYLVKRIIEIHGGDIQAGRSSLGGARFRVRLKRVRKVSRRSGS